MARFFPLILFLALLLGACTTGDNTPGPQVTPTAPPPPTAAARLPTPTLDLPAPTASPTPLPAPVNIGYTISAKLNYAWRTVAVEEQVNYTNNSGDSLNELVVMVEPNQQPGVFILQSLTLDGGQAVKDYTLENNQLHIPLPAQLLPYHSLRVDLVFSLQLPEIPTPVDDLRPVPFGYTSQQLNLVDWYPSLAPYRSGKGWLAHKPWFYGEHQVYDNSDFNVTIELVDPPSGLVVAASAPAQQNGNQFTYTITDARNFVLSASQYYKVFTQQVGAVTVNSYAFTFDVTAGEAALQHTAAALDLYSQIFSPYPHASLTVVEADFLDGMEYDGLYFLSKGFYNLYNGTPQGYLAAIAAHETAHQWWYALVANDQALEPWLDEALCTYTEYIYYSKVHPEYLKWWWDFRVDYYEPQGKINLQLYDYTSYRNYRDAVYLNGAHFLDELRILVGDDAFYAFLKDYAATYKGQIVTASDFFTLLNKHTQKDYSGLLKKYFN